MTCTNPECRRVIVENIMFHLELFRHYARVLPEEDRHIFAKLFGRGVAKVGDEPEKALAEAIDILARNGVEMTIRSNTQEIRFEPGHANTTSSD